MKKIPLSKNRFAIVDDDDFEYLSRWSWQLGSHGYAARTTYVKGSGRKNQKNEHILMHRVVNKTPEGMLTDHINRDKLDNRKANLRTANKSLNSINRPVQPNNKSGHKGVHWFKRLGVWQVYINIDSKRINLGYFSTIEEAIKARQNAEKMYHTNITKK